MLICFEGEEISLRGVIFLFKDEGVDLVGVSSERVVFTATVDGEDTILVGRRRSTRKGYKASML